MWVYLDLTLEIFFIYFFTVPHASGHIEIYLLFSMLSVNLKLLLNLTYTD